MRTVLCLTCFAVLLAPGVASAQAVDLFGSAGPTVTDAGHSVAVGVGVSPVSRLTFAFERTHLASRTKIYDGVTSHFRGGTLLLGTAELRFTPLGRQRIGPYALAGVATGVSRPNVNQVFPNPVSDRVGAVFFGGGIHLPIRDQVTAFVDGRM